MTELEKAQAELSEIRAKRAEVQAKLTGQPVSSATLVPASAVNGQGAGASLVKTAVLVGAGLVVFVIGKKVIARYRKNPRSRRQRRR